MHILLTGASGFIGRTLCPPLLDAGHELSALVRREGSAPPGVRGVRGDLTDAEGLTETLLETAPDCVVHLAAEIASQRDERLINEVNIAGTERLLEACRALGAAAERPGPRFVFCSKVVTGDARGALLTEEQPLPVATPYGRSKQEGERLVLSSGLPAVIVRPSHVYGPGGWFAEELVPRLRQPGRFAVIGSGANLWDVVHVDDLSSALVRALDVGVAGSIYHVVDDQPITYGDFMGLTAAALGLGKPRRIPAQIARAVAGSNAVDAVLRSARSSNAKAKAELGWLPRFASAREGVPDAVARLPAA
jgi:nucleoside-diphosphate-sugar epimerase